LRNTVPVNNFHFKSWNQSYETYFFVKHRFYQFSAIKPGYSKAQTIFSDATNTQALKNLKNKEIKVWLD
jgi:hypothetical protein